MSERSELCAVPSAREERRGPAGAARRIASRPVLSLGYFSLHEQREVTRSCEAGVKALLSSTCFHALPLDFPAIGRARFSWLTLWPALGSPSNGGSGIRGFRSPSGREPPSLLVQRNGARRRRFSTAESLVNTPLPQRFPYQRHSGSTPPPGFFDETQLRCSWGRGSRLTAPARSPGRSSASPTSAEPMLVAPAGSCPSAPSLRKGTRKSNAKEKTKSRQRQQQQASG